MDGRGARGSAGEDAAAAWYRTNGFRVVSRNWRCSIGELDLVVARGRLLVICEVKTRGRGGFGAGYDAVDHRKRRKLRQLGEAFLQTSALRPEAVRFDVASVAMSRDGAPSVEVFVDAF